MLSLVEITAFRLDSKSCKGFFKVNFPPMRALEFITGHVNILTISNWKPPKTVRMLNSPQELISFLCDCSKERRGCSVVDPKQTSFSNWLSPLMARRNKKEVDRNLAQEPSLNTQSCNRRPLLSTFRFENVHSPKKTIFQKHLF